jgi:hypothetical protein
MFKICLYYFFCFRFLQAIAGQLKQLCFLKYMCTMPYISTKKIDKRQEQDLLPIPSFEIPILKIQKQMLPIIGF